MLIRKGFRLRFDAATVVSLAVLAMASLALPQVAHGQQLPQWRVMPIRSQEQFEQRIIGGENTQHMQGVARSASNPDVIYMSHDVAQTWRSDDAGLNWIKPLNRGMYVHCGQSIQVDPADPNIVFAIVDDSSNYLISDFQGLYRSTNGGDDWTLVLQATSGNQRFYQHNIDYDRTSVAEGRAMRWYAGFPGGSLHRSDDGGDSWTVQSTLSGHDPLYAVHSHPTNGNVVYVCSSQGLYRSINGGAGLTKLGDLPAGAVSSLAINPQNPSQIYAVVRGVGLYRSNDGGTTFAQLRSFDALYVFLNPGFPQVIYLIGNGTQSIVSDDSGTTWTTVVVTPPPGLDTSWKTSMRGGHTGVVPDPRQAGKAVAFFNAQFWRTDNGGRNWYDSSTFFTGFAWGWWADSLAFDISDSSRWVMFCADVSMIKTENGGQWFTRHRVPYDWYQQGLIPWIGTYSGAIQPVTGSQTIICSAGMYFNNKLIRTTDGGANWSIVVNDIRNFLFVGFHPEEPNLCFTENLRSTDAGATWQPIQYLVDNNAQIMGMCSAQPDTLYAVGSPRSKIYRSDDRGLSWRLYASVSWSFARLDSKPTFAVHPTNPDIVYTVDSSGDLASFDGQTWRSLGVLAAAGGSGPQRNFVRMVTLDPQHPEIIYTFMAAPGRSHVFRSVDAGVNWTDISGNLPRTGAGIYVHPHTGELMFGSAFGTWILPPPYESPEAIYHRLVFDLATSQWLSVADHGAAGPIGLPLVAGFVEPRMGGPRQIVIDLSAPADPQTLPADGITIVAAPLGQGGEAVDVTDSIEEVRWEEGNARLVIALSQPLPDGKACTVSISPQLASLGGWPIVGNLSATLRLLAGDADSSGTVDAGDILAVRQQAGRALAEGGARFDLDRSGRVSGTDLQAVRRIMQQAP